MSSRASGYMSAFMQSRREALQIAQNAALADLQNDQVRFNAEREFYRESISDLDKQILEYDKMLNDVRQAQSELRQPRLTRQSFGSQRMAFEAGKNVTAQKTNQETLNAKVAAIREKTGIPPALKARIDAVVAVVAKEEAGTSAIKNTINEESSRIGTQLLGLENAEQMASTLEYMQTQLGTLDPQMEYRAAEFLGGALASENPKFQKLREYVGAMDAGEGLDLTKVTEALEIEAGVPQDREQLARLREAFRIRSGDPAFSVSGTREVMGLGEAERLKLQQSEGFRRTASALADDGVISDAERKALAQAEINPDDFLDNQLMQSIARSGLLQSERQALVGRRASAQQSAASLIRPDMSDARLRELTAMRFGPAGITPTQALLQPGKTAERVREARDRFSAKEAMISGVMQAASGNLPSLPDSDNVYASQLTQAIQGANQPAIRQVFDLMEEAGVGPERTTNAFAVASQRAAKLEAAREAKRIQGESDK